MKEVIKIKCENNDTALFVNEGSTLGEVLKALSLNNPLPFIAAYVNNALRELSYRIYNPVSLRFIDTTHFEGIRVYQRTLFFVLDKAVHDLYPGATLRIKNSVSKGFYCEIEGVEITDEVVDRLRMRVDELISQNLPIVHEQLPREEVEELYKKSGYDDKLALLQTRPRLYVSVYSLGGTVGYFFGALATSTGALHLFDLRRYYDGLYLGLPCRDDPNKLEHMISQEKMFEVFAEYKQWVDVMGVPTIGYLNHKILAGEESELIKVAEAFSEKKFGALADVIAEANRERGVRLILISGPSSSGKTTSAKRLGIQLKILGLTPVLISLDDYFVERDKTPLDENGKHDYEALEALDLDVFNSDLVALFAGESVNIPSYDFITGRRQQRTKPLQLDDRSILVVEGIHGLNPRLTEKIDNCYKFRIYVSALTSIAMDNLSRIPTTDNRLIRRMVRDFRTRGSNALDTLRRWGSVRRGEEKHIFPYQENADVMLNSAMFYEISVLKRFVEPLLHTIPDTEPEYGEARRLLKLIDNFIPVDPDEIPPTSILREFIGGSSFTY